MKSRMFAMLSSLTLLTAAGALAQSGDLLKADIPFEFRVGDTRMPAGHYDLRVGTTSGAVWIRSGHNAASSLTYAVDTHAKGDNGKLVFTRYGKTYVLSTVCTPGNKGRQLSAPKANREWARSTVPESVVEVALSTR